MGRADGADGTAGRSLTLPPTDLRRYAGGKGASDADLFRAIADGGKHLKTEMPAWRKGLSAADRWAVVLYLRHGLGAAVK